MRLLSLQISAAFLFQAACLPAGEKCVMLGDSLTFAYEAEFGFEINTFFFGTFGDGFGPEVRNWVEILNDPIYRKDRFDVGARNEFSILSKDLLFRHDYNWALPGLKVDELRGFVEGEVTFADLVGEDPDLALLLSLSDLDQDTAFRLSDLEAQLAGDAKRAVFFIGGNDVRAVYGTIYDGGSAGSFVTDFISDASDVLDRVLALKPGIEIVVVNVPHIGITPDVKGIWPGDPVKTGRVTAVLQDLNGQLAALASDRGLGYADVFTQTLGLLAPAPLCIHGIEFVNAGSTTGNLDYVWLNGQYSANFHPNTNAQALIANEIIDAFNTRYGTGIAPLSATEILGALHGKSTLEIDMPFADWMGCFGLTGLSERDDSDGDGTPAGVEFALGLNPTLRDSRKVTTSRVDGGGSPALEMAYPIRLPASTRYSLAPAYSADLATPFAPFVPFTTLPVAGPDGLARALLPLAGGKGFMRLESTLAP